MQYQHRPFVAYSGQYIPNRAARIYSTTGVYICLEIFGLAFHNGKDSAFFGKTYDMSLWEDRIINVKGASDGISSIVTTKRIGWLKYNKNIRECLLIYRKRLIFA